MKFRIKQGIIEVKTTDPYLRSFLVPENDKGINRINVYSNKKNRYFTMVIQTNKKSHSKYWLTESQVKEILNAHAKGES